MANTTENLGGPQTECVQEPQATWAQKILAIKLAAGRVGKSAMRQVDFNLNEGIEHMGYKDYEEFGCDNEDHYIFGEAVHLIEELELPFNEALCEVLAQAGDNADADQAQVTGNGAGA